MSHCLVSPRFQVLMRGGGRVTLERRLGTVGHQEESGRHVRVIFFLARSEVTFSLPCFASSNQNNNVVAESAHAEERAGPGRKMPVKR